jgi:GAF domain-containing protein
MALPLKVQNNLIGVLDVQSEQPQAFNEEDVAIMQLMADQLATAIERTRLLQQVEQNLSDLEQAYGRFTREGWKALDESGLLGNAGYRFDNVRIQPINEPPSLGSEAIQAGNTVMNNNDNKSPEDYTVAIPIKLRGHAIGVVTAKLKEGYNQTTISTIELAIERLAASLESARLYEEARMRADREQSISHVTTAITSSTEYEEILRTTVREIGNVLGNTEVAIQILGDPDGQGSGR